MNSLYLSKLFSLLISLQKWIKVKVEEEEEDDDGDKYLLICVIFFGEQIMILKYKLTYPSGTATALLINSFHTVQGADIAE
jgi:hypothetical protein